jgi:hypothetical protein
LARPSAPKGSPARWFRQVVAGLIAFACLAAVFFALLRWRMNTPEHHLNLGGVVDDLAPGHNHE